MNRASPESSGVLPVVQPVAPVSDDILDVCHDVLGALAVLEINVEMLTELDASVDRQAIAYDARESIDRIAKIVRSVQAAARRRAAA